MFLVLLVVYTECVSTQVGTRFCCPALAFAFLVSASFSAVWHADFAVFGGHGRDVLARSSVMSPWSSGDDRKGWKVTLYGRSLIGKPYPTPSATDFDDVPFLGKFGDSLTDSQLQ